jgi:autonomous glycyl radical cofactor GrcA
MSSDTLGRSTFPVEVTNVSAHGFWLFLEERELFVSFAQFPWFRDAAIGAITNVQLPSAHHLYWPVLDIDLAVESIEHPEKYPLVSAVRSSKA